MKLLLTGDSFAANWNGDYLGWADMLDKDHTVTNLAQCGIGEYKILKQFDGVELEQFDAIIVSHTSPYRIHTALHPLHTDNSIHANSDFIYEDIKGRLPEVEQFFKYYFDLEYAEFIHNMLVKEINTILRDYRVIDTTSIGLRKLFETNRGTVQHLNKEGNKIFFNRILRSLR